MRTWVYAEVSRDGVDSTALELLSKARDLGGDLEAVTLGPGATDAAGPLGKHGAGRVYASDDPVFEEYVAEPAAAALHHLVEQHEPDLMLFATNYDSRDVAGRLSARTGATLMSNALDLPSADVARTAVFGGTTLVDVKLQGSLKLVLVRPKSFVPQPVGGTAEIVPVEIDIGDELKRSRRVERRESAASGPRLEEASVVVAGGRGLA